MSEGGVGALKTCFWSNFPALSFGPYLRSEDELVVSSKKAPVAPAGPLASPSRDSAAPGSPVSFGNAGFLSRGNMSSRDALDCEGTEAIHIHILGIHNMN
jgi:hypothetical protein